MSIQKHPDVAEAEKENPNVVLVAAADLVELKTTYPNWIMLLSCDGAE
jgi:hypothetical protein